MNPCGFRLFNIALLVVSVTGSRPGLAEQVNDDIPSLEMLEFLADWETADGQWIDPAILQQEELKEPTVDEHDES